MNHLEILKKLQLKPVNDKRQPVAVVVQRKEQSTKAAKSVKTRNAEEETVLNSDEEREPGAEQTEKAQPPNQVQAPKQVQAAPITIGFKEDKNFDRKA